MRKPKDHTQQTRSDARVGESSMRVMWSETRDNSQHVQDPGDRRNRLRVLLPSVLGAIEFWGSLASSNTMAMVSVARPSSGNVLSLLATDTSRPQLRVMGAHQFILTVGHTLMPNLSIERTCPGKPGHASHLKH